MRKRTLQRLHYDNVHVKVGDGYQGWPKHAPFDKIIVTCSPEEVPQALVDQLKEGGRMIVPVGQRYQQTLYLFKKTKGKLVSEALLPTLFVPMTGAAEARAPRQARPLAPGFGKRRFRASHRRAAAARRLALFAASDAGQRRRRALGQELCRIPQQRARPRMPGLARVCRGRAQSEQTGRIADGARPRNPPRPKRRSKFPCW